MSYFALSNPKGIIKEWESVRRSIKDTCEGCNSCFLEKDDPKGEDNPNPRGKDNSSILPRLEKLLTLFKKESNLQLIKGAYTVCSEKKCCSPYINESLAGLEYPEDYLKIKKSAA